MAPTFASIIGPTVWFAGMLGLLTIIVYWRETVRFFWPR